jgi:hypothetical protein
MSKQELLERSRDALRAFNALPPEEQKRRLMEHGTINANGEVLFGLEPQAQQEQQSDAGAEKCARQ